MNNFLIGSIGVCTEEDSGRLYRLDSVNNGLFYLRSIDSPLCFRVCSPDSFWLLVDSL